MGDSLISTRRIQGPVSRRIGEKQVFLYTWIYKIVWFPLPSYACLRLPHLARAPLRRPYVHTGTRQITGCPHPGNKKIRTLQSLRIFLILTTLAESTGALLSRMIRTMSRKPPWAAKNNAVVPVWKMDNTSYWNSIDIVTECNLVGINKIDMSRLHVG